MIPIKPMLAVPERLSPAAAYNTKGANSEGSSLESSTHHRLVAELRRKAIRKAELGAPNWSEGKLVQLP
jgi:hypothetical protein